MVKKYSEKFKTQALALARETSVKNASEKLGGSIKTIYSWRQAKRLAEGPEQQKGDLEAQNRELRRQNEKLFQANQILKKAMGFFVKG